MSGEIKAGDMVACVDAAWSNPDITRRDLPAASGVYSVIDTLDFFGKRFLQVGECATDSDGETIWFFAGCFRKIEPPPRETDISIFRDIDADVFGKVPA